MRLSFSPKTLVFTVLLMSLMGQSALAKKMYRWRDDGGNVFFSDQVPPDQVKHRRESLNREARVVDVVEKQKTIAQRELEKRLARLRAQQEEIIKKQRSHDKVLLSTFRNLDDMELALKGKMLAMDGQLKVVQGNLARLEQQLHQQQKMAAQHERDGRKVPDKLLQKISDSKEQIALIYIEISKQSENKKQVREEFEADIVRFVFLIKSKKENLDPSLKTAEKKAANELGLYICENKKQCEEAWKVAKKFVYTYSTASLDIETDRLIMSQDPYKDTDISLSVSKMDVENDKQQLFLDIRCRNSSIGYELCQGPKAKKIRNSFSGFIRTGLLKPE